MTIWIDGDRARSGNASWTALAASRLPSQATAILASAHGPRAIRDASTLFSFGHSGAYDHEDDVVYLPTDEVTIVDVGDADIVHTDTPRSLANAEFAVRKILAAGALPVSLGGDHSVHAACIAAFSGEEPVHVVQLDAHLDFVSWATVRSRSARAARH